MSAALWLSRHSVTPSKSRSTRLRTPHLPWMDSAAYFFLAQRRLAPAIIRARASGVMAFLIFFGAELAAGFMGVPPAFLLAAQRAFIMAASLARPSSVSPPFFFAGAAFGVEGADLGDGAAVPLTLAQRARVDAAILARASGDRVRRPAFCAGFAVCTLGEATAELPKRDESSACRVSILSAISMARLSCPTDGVLVGIDRRLAAGYPPRQP